MAKTYLSTVKYEITATYEVTGLVEKPDIIGAIFGQSEGLLGQDMDLKELQQNGKIGRIEITVEKGKGKTTGQIIIPSSLDQIKTSILAATVETVEKVGPCEAKIIIQSISDTRKEKREQITDRAKELLQKLQTRDGVETSELSDTIKVGIRTGTIVNYLGLDAGSEAQTSDEIIIVEGRADVLKLIGYGINNVIAMNGSNISQELVKLCREKTTTLLIDGDRGGELNAKKLASMTNVDYVAKAPDGKEVEELTQKEILLSLKRKQPFKDSFKPTFQRQEFSRPFQPRNNYQPNFQQRSNYQGNNYQPNFQPRDNMQRRNDYRPFQPRPNFQPRQNFENREFRNDRPLPRDNFRAEPPQEYAPIVQALPKEIEGLKKDFDKLKGKLKARLLDDKKKKIKDVEVKDVIENITKAKKKIDTVMFDGIVTKRIVDAAEAKGVKNLIGAKSNCTSEKVKIYTFSK